MLLNLLKVTIRNFYKNKFYNFINIVGLTIGIACSIIILMIIKFETSYDNYHSSADRIFRILTKTIQYGETEYTPGVPSLLPDAMKEEYSDFENVAVVDQNYGPALISVQTNNGSIKKFKESDGDFSFVNNDFFQIFDFNWIDGDRKTALIKPYSAVVSKTFAEKYFGDIDAVGKTINFDYTYELSITGVIEDPPQNTEFSNSYLYININRLNPPQGYENWASVSSSVQCFVLLKKNTSKEQVESKFPGFIQKYIPDDTGAKREYSLQKLSDIHFDNRLFNFSNRSVSENTLYALSAIALFLILTACINFINLSTAVAVQRSREVGIRKVLGSSRTKIVIQYLIETFFITLFAVLFSIVLTEVTLPYFNYFTGFQLDPSAFSVAEYASIYFALLLIVSCLSGIYPSLILSRFAPVRAIKNATMEFSGNRYSLRNILVVFQFVISQTLIISTIIISSQMSYFSNADLGLESESIIEFELPGNDKNKLELLKNKLAQIPGVYNSAYSNTGGISGNVWTGIYEINMRPEVKEGRAQVKFVDENYLDTYSIHLVAGEGLIRSDTTDRIVVNESFVKKEGMTNMGILGTYIKIWGREAPVSGVVKDFNTSSLHDEITPVIMMARPENFYVSAVKIETKEISNTIDKTNSAFAEVFPKYILEIKFLDEIIQKLYESELHTGRIMKLFSFIAIIIGCIGLFGLSSFTSMKRTKEIGIRKVLGAGIFDIIRVLNTDYIKLVFFGFLIAGPAAFAIMRKWLEDFAYKIEIIPIYFILGLLITLLIALFTISFQSIKAALINPAETLKYE